VRRLLHIIGGARIILICFFLLIAFAVGRVSAPVPRYYPLKVVTREVLRVPVAGPSSTGSSIKVSRPSGSLPPTAGSSTGKVQQSARKKTCAPGGTGSETFQQCIEREAKRK
jgi:hypothetical protein